VRARPRGISSHYYFGREGLDDCIYFKSFSTKGLDVKLNSGFHIGKGFFIGIAFSYYDTFDADRITSRRTLQ
jgi:hypothetical protein